LKDNRRIHMIVQYIMPIVCGMLVSTALSLLRQASSVLISERVNPFLSAGLVIALFLLMSFLHKKFRINDLILLAAGGFMTITSLGILNYLS